MGKYVKKFGGRPYQYYSEETLKIAVMELKTKKISFRDVEKMYGISKRKVNSKNMKQVGRPNALSEKDEKKLVKEIIRLSSKQRFNFTSMNIQVYVQRSLNKNGVQVKQFTNNLPGYVWFKNVLDRNKSILSD